MKKTMNLETILAIHAHLAKETGGSSGLRDRGLLESALAAPDMSFGGLDLYPTITEKCARLAYSLITNHAFLDGNKRIGMLALLTLLEANGYGITPRKGEIARIGIAVAGGEASYESLLDWVRRQPRKEQRDTPPTET